MRLSGVTRTCPLLISKVAVGGSATSWVVQEFSAQMRSVCKIALHRQANLASFLEQHGMLCDTRGSIVSQTSSLRSQCSMVTLLCIRCSSTSASLSVAGCFSIIV